MRTAALCGRPNNSCAFKMHGNNLAAKINPVKHERRSYGAAAFLDGVTSLSCILNYRIPRLYLSVNGPGAAPIGPADIITNPDFQFFQKSAFPAPGRPRFSAPAAPVADPTFYAPILARV